MELFEKIESYFEKYPNLRVLMFFDPDGFKETDFDLLPPSHYRKVKYAQNPFYLKYHLFGPWAEERVVIYFQLAEPESPADCLHFPLLDVLIANKALKLDNAAELMEQFGLHRSQKNLVERFKKELQHKQVQDLLAPVLSAETFEEMALIQGLWSYTLKFSRIEDWDIIFARLLRVSQPDSEEEWNRIKRKVADLGLFPALQKRIEMQFNLRLDEFSEASFQHALTSIFYNLFVRNLPEFHTEDNYRHLKMSTPVQDQFGFWVEKIKVHPKLLKDWTWLINNAGTAIREDLLVKWYGFSAPYGLYTTPLVFSLLAYAFRTSAKDYVEIEQLVKGLLTETNHENPYRHCVQFLSHATACLKLIQSIPGYILDSPAEYTAAYTRHWYKVDYEYRKAIYFFRFFIDVSGLPEGFPLDQKLTELNNGYRSFLEESNREWLRCLNEKNFEYSQIPVPKQYDFYKDEIEPLDQKVAVLVSDALRYEVAVELMQSLNQDSKNTASCKYNLASIPSITKIGMANLLPCSKMKYFSDSIEVDGQNSSGRLNRETILKSKKPDAKAIPFQDIDRQSITENREIFKSNLVYVYHNHIDAIGDDRKTEMSVFGAVEDTVASLKRLINRIHHSYNVARVIVTADHGFLFHDFIVEEKDKENHSGLAAVTEHSRFELVSSPASVPLGYTFPIGNTSKIDDNLFIIIPRSVNRYKLQGSGNQYVHGGGSLQELIVPVLESSRKKEDITTLVEPRLLGKELKLISNLLKFSLLQEAPVSAMEKERSLLAGIYLGNELVSQEKEIRMNKTSENPSERIFNIDLHLISGSSSLGQNFKLKVFDAENDKDKLNPLIQADIKNHSIISPDF